eukprot:scaffold3224_cov158-Amphora_coffeaeformis.AAC.3
MTAVTTQSEGEKHDRVLEPPKLDARTHQYHTHLIPPNATVPSFGNECSISCYNAFVVGVFTLITQAKGNVPKTTGSPVVFGRLSLEHLCSSPEHASNETKAGSARGKSNSVAHNNNAKRVVYGKKADTVALLVTGCGSQLDNNTIGNAGGEVL